MLADKHRDDLIMARLNEIYGAGGEVSALDSEITALQHRTLARG